MSAAGRFPVSVCARVLLNPRRRPALPQVDWNNRRGLRFSRLQDQEAKMPTPQELEKEFWTSLKSDMTMMLGLVGVAESHARPMTAQLDGEAERGPIFFFTARDTALAQALGMAPRRAFATYAAKGHGLFAALPGGLMLDNDRATIDRLWNRFVAAWFEGGKEDPKLALI